MMKLVNMLDLGSSAARLVGSSPTTRTRTFFFMIGEGSAMNELQKIAVVIDADNTQLVKMQDVLREISTRGRIVVKRAYGNWRKDSLKNWENEIKRLAIKAEQQFDYVSGKNATDMDLVIDTIELLYTNIYDAFVIVSSDSDYTPLAIKLHESGVYVMGVGEKKTPESFRNACDEFLFLENISGIPPTISIKEEDLPQQAETNEAPADGRAADAALNPDLGSAGSTLQACGDEHDADSIDAVHELLKQAYHTYQDDNGYANLAAVGAFLKRTKPDFDCRTYGFTKLPQLLAAFPEKYEVTRYPGKGTVTIVAYKCLEK